MSAFVVFEGEYYRESGLTSRWHFHNQVHTVCVRVEEIQEVFQLKPLVPLHQDDERFRTRISERVYEENKTDLDHYFKVDHGNGDIFFYKFSESVAIILGLNRGNKKNMVVVEGKVEDVMKKINDAVVKYEQQIAVVRYAAVEAEKAKREAAKKE